MNKQVSNNDKKTDTKSQLTSQDLYKHSSKTIHSNYNNLHPRDYTEPHGWFQQKISRRKFLELLAIGGFTSGLIMLGLGKSSSAHAQSSNADSNKNLIDAKTGHVANGSRQDRGIKIRYEIALRDYIMAVQHGNGEEDYYLDAEGNRTFIANFSKSLPHYPANHLKAGEVVGSTYITLINAITSVESDPNEFEKIPGGPRRLVNPVAGVAFELAGLDSHSIAISLPPRIDSAEAAGEMAELYYMALCRDVPFIYYSTDAMIADSVQDLSKNYEEFPVSPYLSAEYTLNAGNIFRGFTRGDLRGPYVSQFLLKGSNEIGENDENDGYIKFGSLNINQRQYALIPELDYLTDYTEWLRIQNGRNVLTGIDTSCGNTYDTSRRRFIRNMRDLASYVHYDELPQPYINAGLLLVHMDAPPCVDLQATYSQYNPYRVSYKRQSSFVTFGFSQILGLITEVATAALKAAWFQKWFVHRRLRPEAFGGLIHAELTHTPNSKYPIHRDIVESAVMSKIFKRNEDLNFRRFGRTNAGSYLLPQVYPEGSPVHPSYPAGHATVGGACVTVLKAFFDENFRIPNPVQASADGTKLIPATNHDGSSLAAPLTVGDELNKLASNIAIGRNMAGIHYRSDYTESLMLGEKVAISILKDKAITFKEKFSLKFTSFQGNTIVIENR